MNIILLPSTTAASVTCVPTRKEASTVRSIRKKKHVTETKVVVVVLYVLNSYLCFHKCFEFFCFPLFFFFFFTSWCLATFVLTIKLVNTASTCSWCFTSTCSERKKKIKKEKRAAKARQPRHNRQQKVDHIVGDGHQDNWL